jgi:hypothetical protein
MERFAFAVWSFFLLFMLFGTKHSLKGTQQRCGLFFSDEQSSVLILPLLINGIIVLVLGCRLYIALYSRELLSADHVIELARLRDFLGK